MSQVEPLLLSPGAGGAAAAGAGAGGAAGASGDSRGAAGASSSDLDQLGGADYLLATAEIDDQMRRAIRTGMKPCMQLNTSHIHKRALCMQYKSGQRQQQCRRGCGSFLRNTGHPHLFAG